MMDEEYGRELLRPLRAESAPPSGLDVVGVVRAGRRRARGRRLFATAGAATAVLVVIPLAFSVGQGLPGPTGFETSQEFAPASRPGPAVPAHCVAAGLPVPDWAISSRVVGGEPTGRYLVGWAEQVGGSRKPLLWDRGSLSILDAPVVDVDHVVVNSAGVFAGSGEEEGSGLQRLSWVYRNGKYSVLPQPGGAMEYITVAGINERGDILGSDNTLDYNRDTGEYYPQQPPLIWPADAAGTFRRLAAPAGEGMARANGIDDSGTVVGTGTSLPARRSETEPEPHTYALVWNSDGTVREVSGDSLIAVRNGWAVGYRKGEPFRVNLSTGAEKQLRLAFLGSVNAHGWAAGNVRQGATELPAVDFGAGQVLKLPMPQGSIAGTEGVLASTISDDGRVVAGSVARGPGSLMAVQWSCS